MAAPRRASPRPCDADGVQDQEEPERAVAAQQWTAVPCNLYALYCTIHTRSQLLSIVFFVFDFVGELSLSIRDVSCDALWGVLARCGSALPAPPGFASHRTRHPRRMPRRQLAGSLSTWYLDDAVQHAE